MKKAKVCLKPPSASLRFAVCWVDCGAFLYSHGPNCGESTRQSKPLLACSKPDPDLNAKSLSKKDWAFCYPGKKPIKSFCRAIAGRVRPKCITKNVDGSYHEQGFALFALCLIMPLLLLLVALLISVSFWLKNFWGAQKFCEEAVLTAQKEMSPLVSNILRLNPKILQLRKLKLATKLKLAAAVSHGNAPLIAALKLQLKAIEAQLLAIGVQQNLNFEKAYRLRFKALTDFKSSSQALGQIQNRNRSYHPSSLGLTREQTIEHPPLYEAKADFTLKQTLEIQWTQNLFQNNPTELLGFLLLKPKPMQRACSASLENKNQKWRSRLLKARASSSY